MMNSRLVLNIDKRQLPSLLPNLTLAGDGAGGADDACRRLRPVAKKPGCRRGSLRLIISDDYTDQSLAVNAVLGAFRAQFRSTQDFTDRCQPFDDRIRARKRDGLTDYLLTLPGPSIQHARRPLQLFPARRAARRHHADVMGGRGDFERAALRLSLHHESGTG